MNSVKCVFGLLFFVVMIITVVITIFVVVSGDPHERAGTTTFDATRGTFEGHSYIRFKRAVGFDGMMIHDPDCSCHKKVE